MKKNKHSLLTKKETNRLKHVGGPRSRKSSRKMLERQISNLEILKKTINIQ